MKSYTSRKIHVRLYMAILAISFGTGLFATNAFAAFQQLCPVEICLTLNGNNIHKVGNCAVSGLSVLTMGAVNNFDLYEYDGIGGVKMYCYRKN